MVIEERRIAAAWSAVPCRCGHLIEPGEPVVRQAAGDPWMHVRCIP